MADDKYTFDQARVRLEEIVTQVRKKDLSLEKSIELLEEGVRLANQCTELSDHTEWRTVAEQREAEREADDAGSEPQGEEQAAAAAADETVAAPVDDSSNSEATEASAEATAESAARTDASDKDAEEG